MCKKKYSDTYRYNLIEENLKYHDRDLLKEFQTLAQIERKHEKRERRHDEHRLRKSQGIKEPNGLALEILLGIIVFVIGALFVIGGDTN
ncbi:MAG: hypothetical protein HeimC2_44940 [Candidatus Heimdallarchaeota archaeon LC_2]|nr:MAG: hypothetical protein HeimC2_44940 [Candidatus Heimdallarchaeota archaeon LC_2]